jgi:arylsulfatase A-like enzyme
MTRDGKNLLIIISDEHRKDAMGCVGHHLVKTPNLDSLAARGTVFENAYTPSPMCVPTRASIATGDYVHKIGNWDSATPYCGKTRSWMRHLRDQGVDVSSIGKLHFRSSDDDNGFVEEILPMHVVGGVGWAIGLLREDTPNYDSSFELSADVGQGKSTYTDYDLEITDGTIKWLKDKQRKDKTWAGFISLVSPHYPLTAPSKYYNMYDTSSIDLPIGYNNPSDPKHSELKNIANFFDYNKYFNEEKMREAKVAYYGLTTFMDDCIGRILADHISQALPGLSLRQIANKKDDLDRTIFSEYHDGGSTTGTFMVRWNSWKYVYYVGYPPQLFNMNADPSELTDLAENINKDPIIEAALKEGVNRLRKICDPEKINSQCFADQKRRIEELGGREACMNAYNFNHTPTPAEQNKLTPS